ncbi:MAG: NUDIX hydrolase [Alphaproteobacteria bacterium]|nr:NUDIX hydrolase [Alphaproteobacteria bacterium]MBV9694848.1 NUDIX hydrolase [Alphaproteobacteria bacterium]
MVMTDGETHVPGVLRPKDAATLILVKRGESGPQVLMGCRHSGMAFMANKYVFPGGRLDPGDQRISVEHNLRPEVMARVCRGITTSRARGLALAAIRETFEETGILVGERGKPPRTRSPAWQRFFDHGIVPRLDGLEMIARAITPPNRSRRFDARFFLADASAIAMTLDTAGHDELLTPSWLTLAEARALDLPGITRRVLDEVELRLADPQGTQRPAPFFRFLRGRTDETWLE